MLYDDPVVISGLEVSCVILELKEYDGVACTFGSLTHKTILLSVQYLHNYHLQHDNIAATVDEMHGILIHEMTHVWQSNGNNTIDSGLLEGIADNVRLNANFAPSHWCRDVVGKWNDGYATTAYFLQHMQITCPSLIIQLNNILWTRDWDPIIIWEITGKTIDEWWSEYILT